MDKLEKIKKFVEEENLKVLENLESATQQMDKADYGVNVGVLYALSKIRQILESDDGLDNK